MGEGADPKRGEARFFVRIDNLRFWLELVAKRLGDLAHRLSAGVGVEELDLLLLTIMHKAKHILHSFFEEWECSYRGLDTG